MLFQASRTPRVVEFAINGTDKIPYKPCSSIMSGRVGASNRKVSKLYFAALNVENLHRRDFCICGVLIAEL